MLVHVRGAAHRHDPAPDQHPRRACARSPRSTRDQEPWFGIEQEYTFFEGGRPLGFPPERLPRSAGRLLLRRRRRRGVRPAHRREAHCEACLDAGLLISGINAEVMPGQWEFQIGPARPLDVSRPAVDGPLAALPHRRGLRRLGHARPQARQGRLERRRRAHQLLHQGHARELRPDHRRLRGARARTSSEHVANYGLGIEDRLTGPARDRPVERVQLRRLRPRRVGPHPLAGREGQEGLHRGPPPERQLRPLRGDHGSSPRPAVPPSRASTWPRSPGPGSRRRRDGASGPRLRRLARRLAQAVAVGIPAEVAAAGRVAGGQGRPAPPGRRRGSRRRRRRARAGEEGRR